MGVRGAADILLADGSTARVRQITASDADAILALHTRLSERTRYLRYFSAYPRIPPRDLERFVNVDHREREAFVIELGGDLVAVGRYERLGPDAEDAEVAFVVQDSYQGRGLGSVLIEHLVAAARQEGIERFVADVLPVNATMLRVFADAGYPVERSYVEGVVHLRFPIAPTPRSVAVQRSREHRAEAASIARLLAPRTVAVYGARADGTGVGGALLRHVRSGFTGTVVSVHPSASMVDGEPAYRSAADAPGPVDLAVVAVPAEAVPAVVADCAAAGVHAVVVVSAGFAEAVPGGAVAGGSVPGGAAAQAELVRLVRGYGMRLVGPNCLGIANTDPTVSLNATLASSLPLAGRVGFFSQSAALGTALLAEADRRGLGLSSFVSAGNRADVSGNDLLQYWRDDPRTGTVLLYLETFGNPRKFARIARELARVKPIVVVAGTVRLSAVEPGLGGGELPPRRPDEGGVAALFASSGVIRVDTVPEMFDVGLMLANQPLPAGRRLAIVTNAAALGVLAAAAAPAAGLTVAPRYPHTVGPGAAGFVQAARSALADPAADAVVAAYVPAFGDELDTVADVAQALGDTVAQVGSPLAAVFPSDATRAARTGPLAVPAYPGVEEAVRALGRVAGYAAWRREPPGTIAELSTVDTGRARLIVAELAAAAPGSTPPAPGSTRKVDELLACYGIPLVPSRQSCGPAAAVVAEAEAVGLPVALKLASAPWRHRIDLGAVRLNLGSAAEVTHAYEQLCGLFGDDVEVLVQPMVAPGVACVVETVDDLAFGPVVGFGLGGVASELLGDRGWRPAPLTDADAVALLRAPRAAPLLTGYRGSAPVDLDALADLLLRIGRLADDHPRVRHLRLNPVLARQDGYSVLHASVDVGAEVLRPDTGPRRLA